MDRAEFGVLRHVFLAAGFCQDALANLHHWLGTPVSEGFWRLLSGL